MFYHGRASVRWNARPPYLPCKAFSLPGEGSGIGQIWVRIFMAHYFKTTSRKGLLTSMAPLQTRSNVYPNKVYIIYIMRRYVLVGIEIGKQRHTIPFFWNLTTKDGERHESV